MSRNQQRTMSPIRNVLSDDNTETYLTGLYVRLSVEDGGLSKESESLIHQEQFLMGFIEKRPELILTKIYRDNGETGTNFERPGFAAMMDDVRKGLIKCIVVKDLSRFGRDYIQTGEYIEKIFPFLGVRFISVLEDFDSIQPDAKDMLMVNLKNLMNEAYAKDKSMRICSAFDAKRANGEYNVKYAPYGYLLSGDKKRPYDVDPETAPIVREIFELREQGFSVISIARKMDEKQYMTPMQYALKKGIRQKTKGDNHWAPLSIDRILSNPAYLGHMHLRKTETRMYQGMKRRKVDKSEQFIVENVNEPIITQEQFDAVQGKKRSYNRTGKKKSGKDENIFRGILFCAECGRPLYRSRSKLSNNKILHYFSCPTYRDHLDKYCPHKSGMREDALRVAVLDFVKGQAKIAGEIEVRANAVASVEKLPSKTSILAELKGEIEHQEYLSREAFENYVLGELSEKDYLQSKSKCEQEIARLNEKLYKAEKSAGKGIAEKVNESSAVQRLKSLTRARAVTREMCEELIERIDIDKDQNLTITVKYRDEFEELFRIIKETEADIKNVE